MKSMLRGVNDRVLRLLDGLVLLWVTTWLVVGVATGVEIWRLSRLSDTAKISARAVHRAGEALQLIGDLPLVGRLPGAELRRLGIEPPRRLDTAKVERGR